MSAWRMTPTSSCAGSDAAMALSRAVSPHASPVCPVVPSTCSRSAPLAAAAPPRRQGAPQAAPHRCCSESSAPPGGGSGTAVATATRTPWPPCPARCHPPRPRRWCGPCRAPSCGTSAVRGAGTRPRGVPGVSVGGEHEKGTLNLGGPLWGCGRIGGVLVLGLFQWG